MSTPVQPLAGKIAFVTGASSGLGEHFAMFLAAKGAAVAVAARRTDRLARLVEGIRTQGGRAHAVAMDVTDVARVRAAVAEAETALGPIYILVNNSGVSTPQKAVDVEERDFGFIMDTNAKGAFFVAQAVGRSMIKAERPGRIVNIASVAGLRTLGQLAVYCMSKAAVVHMTRALAAEWARHGINVNAICPGYIVTEMNRDYLESDASAKLRAMMPRRRWGKPEDLDGMLLGLVGPGSDFINGAIISTDDGLSAS